MAANYGIDILTRAKLIERVSRPIDENFKEHVGRWAQLNNDGSISNVVAGSPAKINKMIMSSASTNKYESHDMQVGRVTTMESIGVRCLVPTDSIDGVINQGDRLIVSVTVGSTGKLVSAETYGESGTYEIVAQCEAINITDGWMVFRTISPTMITIA